MALGNFTFWEIQTGGSDTVNGGGFDNQNTNMLTDLTATLATSAAPVVASASYSFVAGDIGYHVFIKAGTNWLSGWYPIVSTSGGAATLDATAGHGVSYYTQTAGKNINVLQPNAVAGVATVASPTAGTWAIDYSQNATPRFTYTDLAIDATTNTKLTSAANPFGKQMVGNILPIRSGTGFTVQRVQIVSVTTVVATVDKSLGTLSSVSGVGALGGCLATPAMATGLMVSGGNNGIYIKAGTYLGTVNTVNVSGGKMEPTASFPSNNNNYMFIFGYSSVRGDNPKTVAAGQPLIQGTAGVTYLLYVKTQGMKVGYLSLDSQNRASSLAMRMDNPFVAAYYINMLNCTNGGYIGGSTSQTLYFCTYTGGTMIGPAYAGGGGGSTLIGCVAHDYVASGNAYGYQGGNWTLMNCIAYNISGGQGDGFNLNQYSFVYNCIAYNCGRDGFRSASDSSRSQSIKVNCLAVNNAARGFGNTTANDPLETVLLNCAGYNNTSGNVENGYNLVTGFVALSANPFTNAGSGDFTLNNTAGGGMPCRAAGYPGLLPGLTGIGYADIGVYQHADPAGGGGSQTAVAYVD